VRLRSAKALLGMVVCVGLVAGCKAKPSGPLLEITQRSPRWARASGMPFLVRVRPAPCTKDVAEPPPAHALVSNPRRPARFT